MLPQLQPQNSKVRKILFPEFFYGYFADFLKCQVLFI